jgi:methylthioribulose-1-phosphate dehydratase
MMDGAAHTGVISCSVEHSRETCDLSTKSIIQKIAAIGKEFHQRGWNPATSGNFSAVISRDPLRLAVTATGTDSSAITPDQLLEVDSSGAVIGSARRASAEMPLHLVIVKLRKAGAVLHTHSIWNTILSDEYSDQGGIAIQGYEMLKGLSGVESHLHREWLPIVENSQDMPVLSRVIEHTLQQHPAAHGFLLRGHGLYTWGEDLAEAKRHIEAFEFLLEVVGRQRTMLVKGNRYGSGQGS